MQFIHRLTAYFVRSDEKESLDFSLLTGYNKDTQRIAQRICDMHEQYKGGY